MSQEGSWKGARAVGLFVGGANEVVSGVSACKHWSWGELWQRPLPFGSIKGPETETINGVGLYLCARLLAVCGLVEEEEEGTQKQS